MSTSWTQKDLLTEQLRQLIKQQVLEANETNRAEASLTALSFQSLLYPQRHVWIETDSEGAAIDLEDWTVENAWDNVVTQVDVTTFSEVIDIVRTWLSGVRLENHEDERHFSTGSINVSA